MTTARLLIAEDNEANMDMLDRRLRKRGYQTLLARDGGEAVGLARAERPDLVLMDIGMPVMSGHEALAALRADPLLAATPVISVTAHATTTERAAYEAAGFDACVTKPIDLPRLLQEIERLLDRAPRSARGAGAERDPGDLR